MSLILPLSVVIIISVIFILLTKKSSIFSGKVVGHKYTKFILTLYAAILIAALPITFILAKDFIEIERVIHEPVDFEEEHIITDEFYQAAAEGRIDKVEDLESKQWRFVVDDLQLQIVTPLENFNLPIYVERVASLEGEIEVNYYSLRTYVRGIDITERITPPRVEMVDNTLLFHHPEKDEIKLIAFDKEFTITQFEEKNEDRWHHPLINFHTRVLYLRIPEQLQIADHEKHFIQFVNEQEE